MKRTFPESQNRFACINQMEQAVRQKKGGYSEDERQLWLSTLYSCLEAPNDYFVHDETQVSRKKRKKLARHEMKLVKFRRIAAQERDLHGSIYTYLTSVRDLFHKTESYVVHKRSTHNSLAEKLQTAMQQALEKRILENPKLESARKNYQKVLMDTFQTQENRLNHPVFFLLLPYSLTMKLGTCEGIVSETNPFSVPQLDGNSFNWTIRNSPVKASNQKNCEQLDELYDLVEETLCKTLHECGYCSIGQMLLSTIYDCKSRYEYQEKTDELALEDEKIEYAADFSAPVWNYDIWTVCFCEQFGVETNVLLPDMHQLFNLKLRASSKPAQRSANNILRKYANYCKELRNRTFSLSELLDALCNIYSLQYFQDDAPFENEYLRQAVDLLMDFLIDSKVYLAETATNQIDEKWLFLLRYGCSEIGEDTESWYSSMDHCLVNLGRVLHRAVLMRSFASKAKVPKRYGLSEFFPYSTTLEKLSNSLYHAMCSEKAVLCDVAYWGGIKIKLDKKYDHTLRDAFHIWSVWHKDEVAQFKEYFCYLDSHSDYLLTALSTLNPVGKKAVVIDLSTFDFDVGTSDALANPQKQLFTSIPELKKIFGLPRNLDDFRYACILYFLFRTLRDRMCRQAFSLYTKLLQLT